MARKPSFSHNPEIVEEFIDTAYDTVKIVADNIDEVLAAGGNAATATTKAAEAAASAAEALDNRELTDANVLSAEDSQLEANDWANRPEDLLTRTFLNGVGTDRAAGNYSALHWEAKTKADGVLTNADALATAADRVQTGLDRVATGDDRTAVAADLVQTNQDTIDTAADLVQTNLDQIQTTADAVATAADRVQTGLDRVATGADRVAVAADLTQTNLDTIATAADLVQTNLDTIATAADRVATNADAATSTTQAGIATTQATAASNSAAAALSSKNAAATSATNAAGSASSAATALSDMNVIFDNFDDRFLGSKAADPTLDNDGLALLVGAVYYNTVTPGVRFYNGVTWDDPDASSASSASAAYASEIAAALSAANALTSEGNASTSAAAALVSEGNAATSASTATSQASTATTQAGIATTQASNAAGSASASSASAATSTTQADYSQEWANKATDVSIAAGGGVGVKSAKTRATESADSAAASLASQNLASDYANKPEDVLGVNSGTYSALHYAAKAATSATSAGASETSALESLESFEAVWLGPKIADPVLDNKGGALVAGQVYFNITTSILMYYSGTTWYSERTSLGSHNSLATAGQTSVAVDGGYTQGSVIVTLNGVVMSADEYIASDGVNIVFNSPLGLNDVIFIMKFDAVTLVNTVTPTDVSAAGFAFVLDEPDMVSDSATKLATQQSIKTYVDSSIGELANADSALLVNAGYF